MRATLLLIATILILAAPARAQDATDNPFANFGGTDYFPASSGTVSLTNTRLAQPGNNLSGPSLSSGSSSLSTGGVASGVPDARFQSGPSLNGGGAPSSVPTGF